MVTAMIKPITASDKPLLSVRDLRKSYGDHEILKGISFDLMAGETLVLIGPSGSGKTTVLRCLNHLETPSGGEITLAGDTIGGSYVGEAARWEPMSETKLALQRRKFGFVPALQSLSASDGIAERRHRPPQGARLVEGRGRGQGSRTARARQPG